MIYSCPLFQYLMSLYCFWIIIYSIITITCYVVVLKWVISLLLTPKSKGTNRQTSLVPMLKKMWLKQLNQVKFFLLLYERLDDCETPSFLSAVPKFSKFSSGRLSGEFIWSTIKACRQPVPSVYFGRFNRPPLSSLKASLTPKRNYLKWTKVK